MDVKKFAGLILLLSLLLVYPAVAQANSYQKIVVISFSYSGTGIKEVSSEIHTGFRPTSISKPAVLRVCFSMGRTGSLMNFPSGIPVPR